MRSFWISEVFSSKQCTNTLNAICMEEHFSVLGDIAERYLTHASIRTGIGVILRTLKTSSHLYSNLLIKNKAISNQN